MKKGREKGSKAKNRIKDIKSVRDGVQAYENALDKGETSEEYKKRTGISKSKISGQRKSIKKKENK